MANSALLTGVGLEGALGALAVLFVNPPIVMAGHMGIALLSFAASALLPLQIRKVETAEPVQERTSIVTEPGFQMFTWIALWSVPYAYVAIYVGAYVASTGDGGMFQGWPFPSETPSQVGMAFWIDVLHRSVAGGYWILMASLTVLSSRVRHRAPHLFRSSILALALVSLQAVSGALLIVTHLSVGAFLLHVTNISVLFATQCYMAVEVWQARRQRPIGLTSPKARWHHAS